MKKPVLNGKTDTMAKMGTGCFNSNVLLETSPKKSIQASKFQPVNDGGGFSDLLAINHGNSGDLRRNLSQMNCINKH